MLIIRFRVEARPDNVEELASALSAVVGPSRELEGVVHFDVARDLTNPNAFIATEVFEDQAAMERQDALPEVAAALTVVGESAIGPPEATLFHVGSSEPLA